MIFDKLGIDTQEVLEAAGTKWNFLKFKPGLVGGHCIGVDPYYLTYKAKEIGYHPEIILAGRRLNDNMGIYVANKVIKLMIKKGHTIKGSKVLQFLGVFEHFYKTSIFGYSISTHYINLAFLLNLSFEIKKLQKEQHSEYKYFTKEEILDSDEVHEYVKNYFKGNKYV